MTPDQVADRLRRIPSETSLADRIALFDLAATHFRGEGMIYDIGTAAGGSTCCLGAGLAANAMSEADKRHKILGFDLFAGYSIHAFRNSKPVKAMIEARGKPFETDLEMFEAINAEYLDYIKPVQLNLVTGFADYARPGGLEIAHIDAAKSLELWNAILAVIAQSVMPGHTILVFQDFERCRLPWQWMFVADMLQSGAADWVGQYDGGTVHLKLTHAIPQSVYDRSIGFQYTRQDALSHFAFLRDWIASDPARVEVFRGRFDDIATCVLAYIHKEFGDVSEARTAFDALTPQFLQSEPIYKNELTKFLG
ncbi:MAG: hypothetical protein AAF382_06510 [Pseudomonadota bacterium]